LYFGTSNLCFRTPILYFGASILYIGSTKSEFGSTNLNLKVPTSTCLRNRPRFPKAEKTSSFPTGRKILEFSSRKNLNRL
jgi:hypothetical protein